MAVATELLDKYRTACSLASDMALADKLGVTRALVSKWRAGDRQPQTTEIEKMCKATGEDEGVWLTLLAAERAETPAARTSLLRMVDLAKRYGHAACLALALGVVPHNAKAAEHFQALASSHDVAPVYIMRSYRWLARLPKPEFQPVALCNRFGAKFILKRAGLVSHG